MLYLYNIICKYTLLFILHFHKKITFAKNILVMIQSMTGYGKATAIFGEKKLRRDQVFK